MTTLSDDPAVGVTAPGLAAAESATSVDEAAIATCVEAVAVLVDLQAFDRLETLFAKEVRVDYTSLFGGGVERLGAPELMARWAGLLPGFDATRHAISDIRVEIDGDSASARAAVTGTHWLEGESWVVSGLYVYEFARRGRWWRITSMTLHATEETGDRGLADRAAARVSG